MCHPYTEICTVFSFVKKKMGLRNNYLAYVGVHIWTTETSACFSQYFDVNVMNTNLDLKSKLA